MRVVAAVLLVSLSGCSGSWETEHVAEIAASPEIVWQLLADLPGYRDWNGYTTHAEGVLEEGDIVVVTARLGTEIRTVRNRVTTVEAQKALCWHSLNWYESLARGTRCRWLEARPDGGTRFRHHEVMEGPLAGVVERLYRDRIDAGLMAMNADLKRAAERAAR